MSVLISLNTNIYCDKLEEISNLEIFLNALAICPPLPYVILLYTPFFLSGQRSRLFS